MVHKRGRFALLGFVADGGLVEADDAGGVVFEVALPRDVIFGRLPADDPPLPPSCPPEEYLPVEPRSCPPPFAVT